MPAKTKKTAEIPKDKEIFFVCKFCGETKPLSEMVVIRHFFPQVPSCKECSKDTISSEQPGMPIQ